MNKRTLSVGLAAVFAASSICSAAMAQEPVTSTAVTGNSRPATVDLSAFDCRSFIKMNGEYRDNAVLFLHGYVSGQKKQTMIELAPIAASTDRIMDYCISHPNANALTAFMTHR